MRANRSLCFLLLAVLLMAGLALAQTKTIRGVVISQEDRSPLVGVNILVKGTQKGTTTDEDGVFILEDVSPQDVLVFMYVGYQTLEMPVGSKERLEVRMVPEAVSGEEVVVVGYGTQKRKDLTNAVASLDESDFNRGSVTDPQQLLQARVPGVTITSSNGDLGAAPLIRIRGGTSVSASNDPMIVIDGVPIDNSSALPVIDTGTDNPGDGLRDNPLATLNPNDIESIDILKDASAAAIYGARGANGVILITTKSGRAGVTALNYEVRTGISSQARKYDLLNASEYKAFAQKVGATPVMLNANTDWQDAVSQTAFSHYHHLSFSTGGKNTQYMISASYLDEEGIIIGSDRKRISGRFNINHSAWDNRLRLGLRVNPSFTWRNIAPYRQTGGFRGGLFTNVLKYNPTLPVRNDDGSFYHFPNPDIRNPVAMAELIDDKGKLLRVLANGFAEVDLLPNLTGKVSLGLDRSEGKRGVYQPNKLPYAAAFGGRADVQSNSRDNVLFESTLNYRGKLAPDQSIEVWAGYSFQEFHNSNFRAAAEDFVTDAFSFNNLSAGSNFTIRPSSFASENRLISLLGRVFYNLKDKYLINAAIRREGSSRFGKDNKWGTFPSVSVGWRLSGESFFQNMKSLSNLKLRLSWGITGNQDIGDFRSLLILGPGANAVLGDEILTGISPTQLANPDLKWEETKQWNLGLDFGLWDNRVSGSIDVYKKNTTDLLLEFSVPQPAVVETRLDNAGEVENKGIEIALNTINVAKGDLFWRSSINFASNKNEVKSLGGRDFIITGRVSGAGLSGVNAQIYLPGHPVGTFFGPKFLGFDADGNEILSTDPNRPESTQGPLKDGRFILGDAQPDWTFGISNIIVWKKFDLRFYVQGVIGFELLNNTRLEYQRPSNVFNSINMFADAVKDVENGMNPNATVNYSDRFIEDGSFVRLQNVTLGYTFKTSLLRNLRIYLSADNLLLITGYKGLDPEVNTFADVGGVPSLGIDYTNYPRARTFTLGMNVGIK
ncbi:MAG: TonB-dependent receptor [Calditrichaeota bacterium]|nr:MAG: TonB-dependent receptor [Calditrichota bacterium]